MDELIDNIKEFYIIGHPIQTRIGKLHHILVEEYPVLIEYYNILVLDKTLLNAFLDRLWKGSEDTNIKKSIEHLKQMSLIDFIKANGHPNSGFYSLYRQYKELFELCFKDDVFDLVETDEQLELYINLINDMNALQLEKPSPNPEVERRNQLRRMLMSSRAETISFEARFTSVEALTGRDPNKMTLYRFFKLFDRISQKINYDTTTMYAMMSSEVKVEPWYKDIKTEKKEQYLSEEQLEKARKQKGLQENV